MGFRRYRQSHGIVRGAPRGDQRQHRVRFHQHLHGGDGNFALADATLLSAAWQPVAVGESVFTLNGPAVGALGSPVASSAMTNVMAVGIMARGLDNTFAVPADRSLEISRFEATVFIPLGSVFTFR